MYSGKKGPSFPIAFTCPLKEDCVAGSFFEMYCPAFEGFMSIEGLPAVRCRSSSCGYEVPCPKCGEITRFIKSETELSNWICMACGYYEIPSYIDTKYERRGYTLPVKCKCGCKSLVIPDPYSSISEQGWKCPECHEIHIVFEVLDKEE